MGVHGCELHFIFAIPCHFYGYFELSLFFRLEAKLLCSLSSGFLKPNLYFQAIGSTKKNMLDDTNIIYASSFLNCSQINHAIKLLKDLIAVKKLRTPYEITLVPSKQYQHDFRTC